MLLGLVAGALAAPDRVATFYAVGSEVVDVVATPDGAWVIANDPISGKLEVVDTATWEPLTIEACAGTRGLAVAEHDAGWAVYAGCEGGEIVRALLDTTTLQVTRDEAWSATAGEGGDVLAVETHEGLVWVVAEGAGNPQVDVIDPETTSRPDGYDGLPTALGYSGLEDTVVVGAYLVVVHGDKNVSKVDLATGSASTNSSESRDVDLVDGVAYDAGARVWLADAQGSVVWFQTADNDMVLDLDDLAGSVTAVGLAEDEGWFYAATDAGTLVLPFADGAISDEVTSTIDGAFDVSEIAAIEGYALGGTASGNLLVLTGNPWVTVSATVDGAEWTAGSVLVEGDEVTLAVASDEAGEYEIVRDGFVLASGSIAADDAVGATLTVSGWDEGANRVWAYVTGEDGDVGHGAIDLSVDNPPSTPVLDADGVGWGESRAVVAFDGIDDADLEGYRVYVSDVPFTAEEYPSGGPDDFDPEDALTLPLELAREPGEAVEASVSPLENGVTYYVAVRAVDARQESEMSEIRSVTPSKTYTAAELAGEEGGFCGLVGPGPAGLGGIALAVAALLRRRAALGVAAVALVAPSVASAADDDELTPRTSQVQVRVGSLHLTDENLNEVFGTDGHTLFTFEYGWSSRFVEFGAGTGWMRDEGWQVSSSGEESIDADNLTLIPLTLSLAGRLAIVDEQILVPFARVGGDATLFLEDWDVPEDSSDQETLSGMKYGFHYGGGLALLLDSLDRGGATRLEARTGINDTYIVAEYRRTTMLTAAEGYDLGRQELSFGLKFDF